MESSYETILISKSDLQAVAQKMLDKGYIESENESAAKSAIVKALVSWLGTDVIDVILNDIYTYTYDHRHSLGEFDDRLEIAANGEGLENCPGCGVVLTVGGEYCRNCED